jgi:hypothetical protein
LKGKIGFLGAEKETRGGKRYFPKQMLAFPTRH